MRGQGSMPSHARQVDERDIWSVVLSIRQMQKVEPVAPAVAPASGSTGTPAAASASAPGRASADKMAGQAPKTPGGKK
jgi:hypothetical protein